MQEKATLQWKMRVSPQEKKMIVAVAKHYRCKQSAFFKLMICELYAAKIAEKTNSNKQPSPA